MHDVIFGENFEGFYHLPEIDECSFFREGSLFLHKFIECSSIAKFINKIKVIYSFKHINILDDVRTILNRWQNIYFVYCTLLEFWNLLELVGVDDFDGDLLFSFHMNCLINFSVNSLAELFLHRVIFDNFSHSYTSQAWERLSLKS